MYWFVRRWTQQQPNVVIAICGKKGSGKDTCTVKIRQWMWTLAGHPFKHRTFAKPLKDVVQLLTNCSNDKLHTHEGKESVFVNPFYTPEMRGMPETYRDILKSVGKATRRFLANWIHQQWKRECYLWNNTCKLPNLWILSDLRLEDELKWVRNLTNDNTKVFVIRVESPRDSDKDIGGDSDVTETSIDSFPKSEIDFTIYNTKWDDNQSHLDMQCKNICVTIITSLMSK